MIRALLRRFGPVHEHDWGMVPVVGGFSIPHPHFAGLAEHRAQCLSCGERPPYGSAEYEQASANHNRRVSAMLEARGE